MSKYYGKLVDVLHLWIHDERIKLSPYSCVHLLNALEPIIKKAEKKGEKKEHKRVVKGTEGYANEIALGLLAYVKRQKQKPIGQWWEDIEHEEGNQCYTRHEDGSFTKGRVMVGNEPQLDADRLRELISLYGSSVQRILKVLDKESEPTQDPEPAQQPIDKELLLALVKTAFEKGKANPGVDTSYLFAYPDIDAMVGELLGMYPREESVVVGSDALDNIE